MAGGRWSYTRRLGPESAPKTGGHSRPLPLLSDLPAGARGIVWSLRGRGAFSARVAALGVTPGAHVTVIQNYGHGPMLIAVRDTTVAIGRGEALKIEVQRADSGARE